MTHWAVPAGRLARPAIASPAKRRRESGKGGGRGPEGGVSEARGRTDGEGSEPFETNRKAGGRSFGGRTNGDGVNRLRHNRDGLGQRPGAALSSGVNAEGRVSEAGSFRKPEVRRDGSRTNPAGGEGFEIIPQE